VDGPLGVRAFERVQRRHQPGDAQLVARAQEQLVGQGRVCARGRLAQALDLRQGLAHERQEALARVGERDVAGGAREQRRAQVVLQAAHALGERGR
jgi:hypothetical protein